MMKRQLKRFLAVCMVLALGISNVMVSEASDAFKNNGYNADVNTYNEEYLRNLMNSYGISPTEQEELLEVERNRLSYRSSTNGLMRGFPSHPEIGDVYTSKHKIGINTLTAGGVSVGQIALSLAKKLNLPVAVALTMAGAFAADYANDHNIKGIYVYVDYTYGPTNDGPLGWTPGYMWYETY